VMLSISTKFRHGNHMKSDEESSGLLTDMRMYSYSMRVHGWQTYTVMLICIRRGSHCSHYLTSDSSGIIWMVNYKIHSAWVRKILLSGMLQCT
jgi:hypothetical protein